MPPSARQSLRRAAQTDVVTHGRFGSLCEAGPMAAVVRAEGLTKRFGANTVLSGADFEIGEGIWGLLGENGAGKTTLIGLVLGLLAPDGGTLETLGSDPRRHGPAVRARIGYSPEHQLFPSDVPAIDFVEHMCELHGIPRRHAPTRASDALWWVDLGEERFRSLGTLSVAWLAP